ncbi:MAG TPA: amidase [Candidatus Limnocylindria bacterium]|nr:amidase [Candidatus Limnocylindria bacterium]
MTDWTLEGLAAAIRAGKISPVEATRDCLARIDRLDGGLRAFIAVDQAGALETARRLEAEQGRGAWRGPLHGVPLAFKDLCFIRGLPTSCGTRTAEYFLAEGDCTVVARLAAAGAVTLGKLNMSELAMGPFGDNAHHGHARNPWRTGHCPGGSSSGSAVAVAAGLALGAVGSDTGGSIRLPAAACGIVGLKPTYGRVSRAGAMPLSWSNDHVGPMARTVRDCALLLQVMAGPDALDATASPAPVPDYVAALDGRVAGLRVGVVENYFFQGIDAEMEAGVRRAADVIAQLGARVSELQVPDPRTMSDVTNIVSRSEASTIHARLLRERPHELQPVVRARLELGMHIPAYDYLQALRLRARLTRGFIAQVFAEVDVLVAPVIPEPAPPLAHATLGPVHELVARQGRFSRLTRPFNGLGLPALSVPCGFSSTGLPLAFQIVGRPFDEATVLRLGDAYQHATDWHLQRPPLS